MTEAELRARLHRDLIEVRDVLDGVGPLDELGGDELTRAEDSFDDVVTRLAEMNLALASLYADPDLSVEGALVAGAVETAIVVIRSTLGAIQAGLDDERARRAA